MDHSYRLWLLTWMYQARIPVGSDISHRGCAYTVLQTVQRHGVYSAVYDTVHYKESLKVFEIRVWHSPGFGLPSVAILHQYAESNVKQYTYICTRMEMFYNNHPKNWKIKTVSEVTFIFTKVFIILLNRWLILTKIVLWPANHVGSPHNCYPLWEVRKHLRKGEQTDIIFFFIFLKLFARLIKTCSFISFINYKNLDFMVNYYFGLPITWKTGSKEWYMMVPQLSGCLLHLVYHKINTRFIIIFTLPNWHDRLHRTFHFILFAKDEKYLRKINNIDYCERAQRDLNYLYGIKFGS